MNKHTYTLGPWTVTHNSWDTSTVYSVEGEVAHVYIDSEADEDTQDKLEQIKEGNATLIAAAPDMLAALEAVESWWLSEQRGVGAPYCIFATRAAIAKATGAQP